MSSPLLGAHRFYCRPNRDRPKLAAIDRLPAPPAAYRLLFNRPLQTNFFPDKIRVYPDGRSSVELEGFWMKLQIERGLFYDNNFAENKAA